MNQPAIIDALFSLTKPTAVNRVFDCKPFDEDLTPKMRSSGIAGAVLAPCNCPQCQHQWSCADRRTHEVTDLVARNPKQLRGLASYDPLRIGESLRWLDESAARGELAGAYAEADCCVSGLDAPRMYPLYGMCDKLRMPVVLDFTSRERWVHHRPQVEVVAADFPELNILLAPPQRLDSGAVMRMMQQFPRISLLLSSQELQSDPALCEYVELQGRERALFRSSSADWAESVEIALSLPLSPAARRAYLSENAIRLFASFGQ